MTERYSTASFDRLENERTQGNGSVPTYQDFESSTMHGGTRTMDILNEMKQLHEERLRRIEQEAGRDSAELKVKALESWVTDLEEQNTMLVQILGKLEQEAGDRVMLLKEKLQSSALAASKFMESEQDRDKLVSHLKEENEHFQNTVMQLFNKHKQLQAHIASQYQQLGRTNEAVQKLQKSSCENNLDESINCVISCFDEVLQERQRLSQEVEMLKSELASKTAEIEQLNNKVLEMDESARDMREALAVEVADKHDQIISLRREIHHLEDKCRQADMQTHFKDDIIKEMRKDLKAAKSRLAVLELQKHNIFVNDREQEGDIHASETNKTPSLARSHSDQRAPVLLKHHYRSNPLSFIPEVSEHTRIEDIYYEIRRRGATKQLVREPAADSNGKNVGTQLEEKQMPEAASCCKEVCVGTEDIANTSPENYVSSKLSVKEIFNYRHMIKSPEETGRNLEGDVKDSHSTFSNRRLQTEETQVQFELRRNFENSSASEEDASMSTVHLKLRSAQNQAKALKDKARAYVQDLRMAEQNQVDSERRIRELKSILEMSQHQVGTVLERASEVDMALPYVQEVQKYNEGSQEAFKNMRAEIHFLLFNLRSRVQKCSDFEESISSLELSLEELQESLSDMQNIMNVNIKFRSNIQDVDHLVKNGFKAIEEEKCSPCTTENTIISVQSAPNQGAFETSDRQSEELQKELNRSKEDQLRYRDQIQELEEEIATLRQKVAEVGILEETLFRMKSELETVTCSLDAKEQIVKDQEEMISILQDSVNTAEKEQAEVLSRLATLENEKEKALSELEEVEKRAENLQEALLATKKQLEELQGSKFELRIRDCIIQFLHLDLSEVQNQYKNCYGEVVKQEKMLDTLQYSNNDLQFEIVNLEQDIGLLEVRLRDKLRSVNNIKERVQELEKKLKERDEELIKQKCECEKLSLAVNDKRKIIENLQENLIQKDKDIRQMKHLEEHCVNLKMKADVLCESVLNLEALNASLKQEMKKHDNEERMLRMQLQNAECENMQKSELIEKLNGQLSHLKYAFDEKESEMQSVSEKYNCLCKTSQSLQESLVAKEELISELQYSLDNVNSKIMNLVADIEHKDAKIQNQQLLIKELRDEVDDKSTWSKIAELTKETTLLKAEISHLREQNEKMSLEKCCLMNKITALNFELEASKSRIAGLLEGNRFLVNVKKQLQKQIKELENELAALQGNVSGEHDMVCIESRNTIMRARRWMEEQRRENEELRARLEHQRQMCHTLLQEYHNLKMKVNELEHVNLMLKKSAQACNVLLTACSNVDESDSSSFYLPIDEDPASIKPSRQHFLRSYQQQIKNYM